MKSKAYSTLWLWLIGLGVIVILVMMLAGPFGPGASVSLTTPIITQSPIASSSATLPGSSTPEGSSLPPTTETPTEEPTATDWPTPDEQATETQIAIVLTQKAEVFATWQQVLTEAPLPTPEPRMTSISDEFRAKVLVEKIGYVIENVWFGLRNGVYINVYAGIHSTEPSQGLVHVLHPSGRETDYLTPIQAGSVHIVESQNDRLVLLSTNGTTFYFDVPTLQFVDSLTAIAPTYTPTPTATTTYTPGPTATPLPTCTPGPTPTANPPIPFVCD